MLAKGEIAQYEQLLIFCHNGFRSRLLQWRQKASVSGKGLTIALSSYIHSISFVLTVTESMTSERKMKNIVGKMHEKINQMLVFTLSTC